VLVEDVLTTGGAALQAAETLRAMGLNVVRVIGVIDREEGAREAFAGKSFDYVALFTKTELGI
jgi:orotate phosphoribosyltransferase